MFTFTIGVGQANVTFCASHSVVMENPNLRLYHDMFDALDTHHAHAIQLQDLQAALHKLDINVR